MPVGAAVPAVHRDLACLCVEDSSFACRAVECVPEAATVSELTSAELRVSVISQGKGGTS
jgi:hypothetical protein